MEKIYKDSIEEAIKSFKNKEFILNFNKFLEKNIQKKMIKV